MALSVPSSVCLSVTFRCFVETNEATIMRFSLSGSKIILVSGEVKIVRKFSGDHPYSEGVKVTDALFCPQSRSFLLISSFSVLCEQTDT